MFSAKYNYVLDANKPVIKLSLTKGSWIKLTLMSIAPFVVLSALGAYANAQDEKNFNETETPIDQ